MRLTTMYTTDSLQKFIFEKASIRGQIAHLDTVFLTILNQRPYPPMVKHLLGEALISCLLLIGSIKFEGELSLQFQSDNRLPLLLVQCDHSLGIRAFAKFTADLSEEDYTQAFLGGQMAIIVNQYNQTQPYQTLLPLQSISMAENIMHYFAQSEQISTQVWLASSPNRVSGMFLQLMPGQGSLQREEFWEYAVHLGQTVSNKELIELDNETLLHRLYHETELRLFEARRVKFQCRCTSEKMQQVLTLLGRDDVEKLITEQGIITITCEFCQQNYNFDAIDTALLFRKT